MFLMEMERIRDQIRGLEEKLRITKGELEEATRQYADTKTEYEAIEEQVEVIDASVEKANRQLNETTILKQQLENQIALLKEQIHSARMNDEHFDQRASVIDSEMDVREGQMKELQTEKDSIVKQMEEKQSEEDQIKNELTELQAKIAQITGSVDEKKNHIMEILNNRASTKAQIQKFDTMMEQIQVRKSQINREILANDSEIAEENENLKKELSKVNIKYQQKEQTVELQNIKLKEYEQRILIIENDKIKDTFFKKRKEYQINRKKYVDCKLKSYLKESYKNILWYLIFIAIAFATQITQTYFKDIIPNILILSITFSAILFLVPFIRSFIKHDKILTSINYIFSKSKRVYINRRIIHDAILSYNHMTKVPIMVLKKAVDEI